MTEYGYLHLTTGILSYTIRMLLPAVFRADSSPLISNAQPFRVDLPNYVFDLVLDTFLDFFGNESMGSVAHIAQHKHYFLKHSSRTVSLVNDEKFCVLGVTGPTSPVS